MDSKAKTPGLTPPYRQHHYYDGIGCITRFDALGNPIHFDGMGRRVNYVSLRGRFFRWIDGVA